MKLKTTVLMLGVAFVCVGCRTSERRVDDIAALIQSVEFELPVELEMTCILPGMPPNIPGRTAVALCGWIDLAQGDSRQGD